VTFTVNWTNEATDYLCDALLQLKSREECYEFLEDLCTVKEITEMSRRLRVAMLLADNESYAYINAATGASTATICRVSKCYEYGSGGYKKIIKRIKDNNNDQ